MATANRATGKVIRIFASSGAFEKTGATYFRLALTKREEMPGGPDVDGNHNGYFFLLPSDANYSALYSLLLVAATNGYRLQARVFGQISPWVSATKPGENAHVNYLVVDWSG
jgi:hypothetical protein